MCGIAGHAGIRFDASVVERMCDSIRHRGPDDAGYFRDSDVSLGMRRLSIIDVGGGHQPISNEDGTIHVVFNGEIYNFHEIRRRLERDGHRFRTATDTEVLVHLYEDAGDGLVRELRGMFAFALWDSRRRRLILARDRLGIKPLYYHVHRGGGLSFGSELKCLAVCPGSPREVSPRALSAYLAFGYVPEPFCVFEGVEKLPPAHLAVWEPESTLHLERYWSPPAEEDASIDEQAAVQEIRRLLEASVRYRMVADVPLGAFLSSGLDSSAVVAEMSRQSDRPVRTFSIGFAEPDFNEAPGAAAIAAELGTDHTELIVEPDVEELFDWIAAAFDEPFADSSAIPTLLVSRLAAESVKVVLSGDGGDELFGGYTRYLDYARRDVALPGVVRGLVGSFGRRLPHGTPGRNRILEIAGTSQDRYFGMVGHPLEPGSGGVASRDLLRSGQGWDEPFRTAWSEANGRGSLDRLMHVDLLTYLPGDILTKIDRMSMAESLECRVPLLDHELVEFAFRIPEALKIRDGLGKQIFRRAVADRVPKAALRKSKQGFGVPLRPWLRTVLRHHIRDLAQAAALQDFVDGRAVERLVREHVRGRRDHSAVLWKLMVLRSWLESIGESGGRLRPAAVAS